MRLDAYRDGVLDGWCAWEEPWSNPDANLLRIKSEVFPPGDCLRTLRSYCHELKRSLLRFNDRAESLSLRGGDLDAECCSREDKRL